MQLFIPFFYFCPRVFKLKNSVHGNWNYGNVFYCSYFKIRVLLSLLSRMRASASLKSLIHICKSAFEPADLDYSL